MSTEVLEPAAPVRENPRALAGRFGAGIELSRKPPAGRVSNGHALRGRRQQNVSHQVLVFVLRSLLGLAVVTLGTVFLSRQLGTSEAIQDAKRVVFLTANGNLSISLDETTLKSLRSPDAEKRLVASRYLDGIVGRAQDSAGLARVKIWDRSGVLLYSDKPELMAANLQLDHDHLEVFDTGEVDAEVSDLSKEENVFERPLGKMMEVYVPMTAANGERLLFEAYLPYDRVVDGGRRVWRNFAPLMLGGLALMQLIQAPLVWSAARGIRRSQREREQLLRLAVTASADERRRIASNLHDGVVQDLTGISLALAAHRRRRRPAASTPDATRSAPDPIDGVLESSEGQIREAVHALRSLLIEIYPPNLREEGLESALHDLCGRLRNRGMAVDLRVELDDAVLSETTTQLVYRTAQEAIRNIANHAEATRVEIDVWAETNMVQLTISDNGDGFDPASIPASTRDGHFGLRSLGDLISEAGATLELFSETGEGTLLRARMPLQLQDPREFLE